MSTTTERMTRQENGFFTCDVCGAEILAARVAHPIHLRAMPGAGFGRCQYEDVPYCPNCDERPSPYGAPVYE